MKLKSLLLLLVCLLTAAVFSACRSSDPAPSPTPAATEAPQAPKAPEPVSSPSPAPTDAPPVAAAGEEKTADEGKTADGEKTTSGNETADGKNAAERGREAILATDYGKNIVLPKEESYLEEWKTLYCRKAWYAPSLWVESISQLQSGVPCQPMLYEGSKVTVVAEENDMSCILYRNLNYKSCAGWIRSVRLLEDFPGPEYVDGQKQDGEFDKIGEVGLSWSKGYYPGLQQRYTVLDEPVRNCVGFEFEYQLIAENTTRKEIVFGDRTVCVNDGQEWIEVACFPYDELGAVRVQVWLSEPTDITAIATVADCHAPNMFDFRQTARDFLTVPSESGK